MSVINALSAGFASALALTAMHECSRKTMPHPPRMDVLGMKGIAKLGRAMGAEPPENLRASAMAGDLAANTAYYALAGAAGPSHALGLGAILGAVAGAGALLLPGPLGLGAAETNRTRQTQVLAAGMYFAAGLIAGGLYSANATLLGNDPDRTVDPVSAARVQRGRA